MTDQAPEILQIDGFRNQFETGNPDEQAAAFYGLAGLARQCVGERDAARRDTDEAMGLVEQAESERDEARAQAEVHQPVDESEELLALRAQVAELTGALAAAQAATTKERRLREEQLAAADAQHEALLRAKQRKLDKATGALRVADSHRCTPERVEGLKRVGVVGTMVVYAYNPVGSQAVNLAIIRQGSDTVNIQYQVIKKVPGGDEEFVATKDQ